MGDLTEKEVLEMLKERFSGLPFDSDAQLLVDIGDDAAAIQNPQGTLIYSSDALVENVHFKLNEIDPFELGWKAIVSNQSDIAAMGGTPQAVLINFGISRHYTKERINRFCDGIQEALAQFGGRVIGGDLTYADPMFVSVSITGTRPAGSSQDNLLRLNGARPGDLVAVTGELGGSEGWLKSRDDLLRARHFKPSPRVSEGVCLADNGVKCATDISDGLLKELNSIADAGGVGILINATNIPIDKQLQEIVPHSTALEYALYGGEEYELVFTAPEGVMAEVQQQLGSVVSVIGRVVDERELSGVRVLDDAGDEINVVHQGWEHRFSDR